MPEMKCPQCGRLMVRVDGTYCIRCPRYPTPEDDLIRYWRCGYCHTCREEVRTIPWWKKLFRRKK